MIRIGHGYDVHKLVPGRKLTLGGVVIPYPFGLQGHSDADVLIHAVMDAVLGACALGDIGKLFPDSDPEFEGADSTELLAEVMEIIREKGFSVNNIDSTVVCQNPKLSPYTDEMCRNIAKICGIDISQVNVKATTEEKMGITGTGQAMTAYAVCTVKKEEC